MQLSTILFDSTQGLANFRPTFEKTYERTEKREQMRRRAFPRVPEPGERAATVRACAQTVHQRHIGARADIRSVRCVSQ